MFNIFIFANHQKQPIQTCDIWWIGSNNKESFIHRLDRSFSSLEREHILYNKGGVACCSSTAHVTSRQTQSPPCKHIPALADNNRPAPHEARYRDPDQFCICGWVVAPACWQCVPHCVPPGVSTHRRRIPHCQPLISVSPAHYAPTRRWGRWLGIQ